jgi:hypothetical protein
MNIIPICPQTLDIIEVLNNGERPELPKGEETFFVFSPVEGVNGGIMKKSEMSDWKDYWTVVRVLYFDMEPTISIVPE